MLLGLGLEFFGLFLRLGHQFIPGFLGGELSQSPLLRSLFDQFRPLIFSRFDELFPGPLRLRTEVLGRCV